MQRHSQIGRQRPRRRRPDHKAHRARITQPQQGFGFSRRRLIHREIHIHALRRNIPVFQFGIRQRRFTPDRPVNGLKLLIDNPVAYQFGKDFQNPLLIDRLERQVRIFKIAEDPQRLELRRLQLDIFGCIFLTMFAKVRFAHRPRRIPQLGHHLDFNRQTMTVPARNIRGLKPAHRPVFHHKILEHLINHMAHVNIAVGVWRTIMQHIQRFALPALKNLLINILLIPVFPLLGFTLDQIGLHRKTRLRQA